MDKEALQNPRVIVIQKLYGHHLNKESELNISNDTFCNNTLSNSTLSNKNIHVSKFTKTYLFDVFWKA